MKLALTHFDDSIPRTAFWDCLSASLRRDPRFVEDESKADILLPAEDVAMEMNWPRYGNHASAFIRGKLDQPSYDRYMSALIADPRRLCIINMYPFIRIPQMVRHKPNLLVADINLAEWERSLNPRTIAMPVPAITDGRGAPHAKNLLASFRGISSHPCRAALARLHDGRDFVFELISPAGHVSKIDATTGQLDAAYTQLMCRSIFAVVPRGDALFSYRLTEAISFGCIPVILSDSWVLPFDRLIDWTSIAIRLPESQVALLPNLLKLFDPSRIAEMRKKLLEVHRRHFSDADAIARSLLDEIELHLPGMVGSATSGAGRDEAI